MSAGFAFARAASHPIVSGVRDFGIARFKSNSRVAVKSPFHGRARGRPGGAGLKTAFLTSFFARDRIATGSGRTSRCATAESENDERQQSQWPQVFH